MKSASYEFFIVQKQICHFKQCSLLRAQIQTLKSLESASHSMMDLKGYIQQHQKINQQSDLTVCNDILHDHSK